MGNRNLRVNELLKREVSQFIHRNLQSQAVAVTVTEVETTSDFRSATVFFSLVSDPSQGPAMEALLNEHAQEINQELRHAITLRNIPRIRFRHDLSMERGCRVVQLLDEIEAEQKRRTP
jgi:ribosome-binding factor A